ncbi:MAG: M56 family metallopeptidase [Parafilimonas sp.]
MRAFLQSAFLQALSHSLIASIWQMALLWLATIALLKLFKLTSAQKFNIAFISQLSGFILFIYTLLHTYNSGAEKIIIGESAGSFLFSVNSIIAECMPYMAIIYLSILSFKLSKLIFVCKDTQQLRKHQLKKISAENRLFVQKMSELFSLRRKVKIYLSEKIKCPLTTGFLKPIILIPIAAINHLTTEQMEAVILHELAHIKRADYLLYILQSFVERIFFFNIFSAMLGDIIERERENACDDWVLQFRYNSMHYAEALFKLGRLKALPAFAMSLSGKKESLLLSRIKRLLHNPQHNSSYNFHSVLLGFFSVMITTCLLISSSFKPSEKKITVAINTITQNKKIVTFLHEKSLPVTIAAVKNEHIKSSENNPHSSKPIIEKKEKLSSDIIAHEVANAEKNILELKQKYLAEKQYYLVQVQQKSDSLQLTFPQYRQALNSQVVVTPSVLQKVISYQNFKEIESMLAASGDSIQVKETGSSKDSYQKQITIESTDKKGNKHTYTVVVELYQ